MQLNLRYKPFALKKGKRIDGRFVAEVDDDNNTLSADEILRKAYDKFTDADFGCLETIDADPVIIEDDTGNYIWEK